MVLNFRFLYQDISKILKPNEWSASIRKFLRICEWWGFAALIWVFILQFLDDKLINYVVLLSNTVLNRSKSLKRKTTKHNQ